jgi:uncharacterized membrane protein
VVDRRNRKRGADHAALARQLPGGAVVTQLAVFSARTGIDEAAASRALNARGTHDNIPWYMQMVLGIGAWITTIAALFFAGVLFALLFEIDEPNLVVAIVGAIEFAASLWLLHHRPNGAFTAHAAVAFATAGTLMAAAGIAVPEESLRLAATATLPFAAAAIWQQRSLLLQFLIVSIALVLCIVAAWEYWNDPVADLPALFIPIGVTLLLYPPRRDVRPTAFALLIVPLLIDLVASKFGGSWTLWHGWAARGLLLAVFALLFAINWKRVSDPQGRLLTIAAAVAVAVVTFLLPVGASAALVLLTLAYTLASRTLALLGALLEIYFIWSFYWDLEGTLLTKSIILMSAGAVVLLCYGLLIGTLRERRAS